MEIINRPTAALVPYEKNPKVHTRKQIKGISESIKRFGFTQPLVVDSAGVVIIGHGRLEAAKLLNLEQVPVVELGSLTPDEVRALRVLDNKLNESPWDMELLQLEVKAIELDLTPFEIDLKGVLEEPEVVEDEGAAADVEAVTTKIKRGDLIELGLHRLLCGSSAEEQDVIRLMNGNKAQLISTDPPYGVAYTDEARVAAERAHGRPERKEKWLGGIENDQLVDDAIQPFLEDCFRAAAVHALHDKAAWYLWHAHLTAAFFAAAAAADVLLHRQIVWVKPSLLFGFGDYHWRHECCFYGWKKGYRPEFYGERNQTSVWEIKHETSNGKRIHPTQKPLELFAIPIKNNTRKGDIVYEPFSGSGSQLIAADQLGRICFGMEIEPKYCQVIVDRYRAYCIKTGKEFSCKINGETLPN